MAPVLSGPHGSWECQPATPNVYDSICHSAVVEPPGLVQIALHLRRTAHQLLSESFRCQHP